MKLWVVLYIAGKVVAAWGPLSEDYTIERCNESVSDNNSMLVIGADTTYKCIEGINPPAFGTLLDIQYELK